MRGWLFEQLADELLHRYWCFPICIRQRCLVRAKASDADGFFPMCLLIRYLLCPWLGYAEFEGFQLCFCTADLRYQLVWTACRRGVSFQIVSACCRSFWCLGFHHWRWFSWISKVGRCITCVIYMWVSRAISWVCYMSWWDWSVGHSFVRWSIDFHRSVSRLCQCLFLFTNGGVALEFCSAGDDL